MTDAEENELGSNTLNPDTDRDGYSDVYEYETGYDPLDPRSVPGPTLRPLVVGGAPVIATAGDSDGDGLPDAYESEIETNPEANDSDGDGIFDGLEVLNGSDPLDSQSGTISDADGDGAADQIEKRLGSNPSNADGDLDQLPDAWELLWNSNPHDHDSDDDGVLDGYQSPKGYRFVNRGFVF